MEETYITQRRVAYLPWSANRYAKKGWEFCVGSAKDCDHFVEAGALRIPWGETPDRRSYKSVKSLVFKPGSKGLRDRAVPAFVRELPNLEHLSIPSTMVQALGPNEIPQTVTGLTIWNVEGADKIIKSKDLRWPAGVTLPHVRAFRLLDEEGGNQSESLLGIGAHELPQLEYVECLINKSTGRLEAIAEFDRLRFVWLEFVRNCNVFEFIPRNVRALSLVSAENKFPFAEVGRLRGLEMLRLNGMKCAIDCRVLTQLPSLREISAYNSRKVEHPAALLACERLESLEFVSCGRPFDTDLQQRLGEANYKRLQIDFA